MLKNLVLIIVFAIAIVLLRQDTVASNDKVELSGKAYEFDSKTDYTFSSAPSFVSTDSYETYGTFSIAGTTSQITNYGKEDNVLAYSVPEGNVSIFYTYSDSLLNASEEEWHIVKDGEKNIDVFKIENNIDKGALILQRSIDHINWSNISIQTNVFENTPIQEGSLYQTLDVEMINGCFYRLIVVYELEKKVGTNYVLGVPVGSDNEYKRIAEVYEFYCKSTDKNIQELTQNTKQYALGKTELVADFAGYSGTKEITKDDLHYGWELGNFFISGFTMNTTDQNGKVVFLKNVGDEVTLWFNLKQNINALNNDKDLTITADSDGYDQTFQTPATNFGRGMLIIRKTNYENIVEEPVMFYNYLEANTLLNSITRVQLFEEGDYEVALDYEVTKDQLVDKVHHYRIFFEFSVRNANCMVFTFDNKTGKELSNNAVAEEGFRLDLAQSRYLDIDIKKEILVEGADGLTEDPRFNTNAKDGDIYVEEGIYTITVKNKYNGLSTSKIIYVGTNGLLKAYINPDNNYTISQLRSFVAEGAVIYEDGTIEFPEEEPLVYTVVWLDGDDSELDRKVFMEGEEEPITDKVPNRNEDEVYTYSFDKWDRGSWDETRTIKTYTPLFISVKKEEPDNSSEQVSIENDSSFESDEAITKNESDIPEETITERTEETGTGSIEQLDSELSSNSTDQVNISSEENNQTRAITDEESSNEGHVTYIIVIVVLAACLFVAVGLIVKRSHKGTEK